MANQQSISHSTAAKSPATTAATPLANSTLNLSSVTSGSAAKQEKTPDLSGASAAKTTENLPAPLSESPPAHATQVISQADLVDPTSLDRNHGILVIRGTEGDEVSVKREHGMGRRLLGNLQNRRAGKPDPSSPAVYDFRFEISLLAEGQVTKFTARSCTFSLVSTPDGTAKIRLLSAREQVGDSDPIDLRPKPAARAPASLGSVATAGSANQTIDGGRETVAMSGQKTAAGEPKANVQVVDDAATKKAEKLASWKRRIIRSSDSFTAKAPPEVENALYTLLRAKVAEATHSGAGKKNSPGVHSAGETRNEAPKRKLLPLEKVLQDIDEIKADPRCEKLPVTCIKLDTIVSPKSNEDPNLKVVVAKFLQSILTRADAKMFHLSWPPITLPPKDQGLCRTVKAFIETTQYNYQIAEQPKKK